jgi:hypothetical protein
MAGVIPAAHRGCPLSCCLPTVYSTASAPLSPPGPTWDVEPELAAPREPLPRSGHAGGLRHAECADPPSTVARQSAVTASGLQTRRNPAASVTSCGCGMLRRCRYSCEVASHCCGPPQPLQVTSTQIDRQTDELLAVWLLALPRRAGLGTNGAQKGLVGVGVRFGLVAGLRPPARSAPQEGGAGGAGSDHTGLRSA